VDARTEIREFLGGNQLGFALCWEMFADAVRPVNTARFVFLGPRAREFSVDWDRAANDVVAVLRSAAGRDPYDRALSDLVGEPSTRSEELRTRWAMHDVRFHISGVKRFRHPVVGELRLRVERLELAADSGLTIFTYTAEPGSRHEEALKAPGKLGRDARRGPVDAAVGPG
jgi:hypothetical protein